MAVILNNTYSNFHNSNLMNNYSNCIQLALKLQQVSHSQMFQKPLMKKCTMEELENEFLSTTSRLR